MGTLVRPARTVGLRLAGLLLVVSGVLAPAHVAAAGITVTTTADGVVADGNCSLREAVISANSDQAVGGCAPGNGVDVIGFAAQLPRPGVIVLTAAGAAEDAAATGDLDLVGEVTIDGGADGAVVVDGNGIDRVLEIRNRFSMICCAQ